MTNETTLTTIAVTLTVIEQSSLSRASLCALHLLTHLIKTSIYRCRCINIDINYTWFKLTLILTYNLCSNHPVIRQNPGNLNPEVHRFQVWGYFCLSCDKT